jgi:DNA repair exonuclease SbcCD ATPase subunit
MSQNSKSSKSLSDLQAMPEFAAVVQIDPEILGMILIELDPAVIEAAELKAVQKDEIKAKIDEAKRLLAQAHEIAKTLNPLCDEQDKAEEERKLLKGILEDALLATRVALANHTKVLENKAQIIKAAPNLMAEFTEKFNAAVIKQTQIAQADNIARLKALDVSFAELDKKTAQLSKQYDEYKVLSTRLFAEADQLKVEYGFA